MSDDPKNSWKRDLLAELRDPVSQGWGTDSSVDHPAPHQESSLSKSVLDTIRSPVKQQRGRAWEKRNRAFSYIVPTPLRSAAIQLREDILSITQYDPDGRQREDKTTVDDVAAILMDWAFHEVQNNPDLIVTRPNPRSHKGQMTVAWEAWQGWEKTPILLKQPTRRQARKSGQKKCVLSFRWSAEIDMRIKALAGVNSTYECKNNPLKFAVPLGELVVILLELAVKGYRSRQFTLRIGVQTTARADGWSR